MVTKIDIESCARKLGFIKNARDLQGQVIAEGQETQQYLHCSDARYTNWLVNDSGSYPKGTWNYKTCLANKNETTCLMGSH